MLIDSPLKKKKSLADLIVIGNRAMLSPKLYYKGNTLGLKENILMREV